MATSLRSLNASNIAVGVVNPACLGSGAPGISTFLRGDNSWAVPPGTGGGGGGVPPGGTTGQVLVKNSNADYDVDWSDSAVNVINGGTF